MELATYIQPRNLVRGFLIYAAGDTAAALLLHEFSWSRLIGMALIGGLLYSVEVPAYFRWIDNRLPPGPGASAGRRWGRAALSLAYFNPLWIARHFVFLRLVSGHPEQVTLDLLPLATKSFLINAPVSLLVNYYIQNKVSAEWRFVASAIFSGIMAVYYAVSATW
ncbi:hypothetical protein CDA63_07540 [Hymenobacter amundsenii]|uniref:Uncharacterized protein n=1 Tax=Hymenobacter amundsenii TaxID=2006685 RepID=A0A246FLK9_9BACT|nr:hypothetical protein [Hymenobacter amundsenii]OWP63637.1 hypothetical protein CDA63_07540 [Hymenobacter amundsenii]